MQPRLKRQNITSITLKPYADVVFTPEKNSETFDIVLVGIAPNPITPGVDATLQYLAADGITWTDVLLGQVMMPVGETSLNIRVIAINDAVVEGTEGFSITLSNPSVDVVFTNATVTGSITETDTNHITLVNTDPPSTVIDEANLLIATYELNRGSTTDPNISVTVNVALTGTGANPVAPTDVLFEEFDGAIWTTVGATLTLAIGEVSKQLRVTGRFM